MAQILKSEVRQRILTAAAQVFAAAGYQRASMAAIAREAGLSTGNIYRYFASKDALFREVVDDSFIERFEQLLDQRVDALGALANVRSLDGDAAAAAEELLSFWIAHRLQVIVLLDRCAGSHLEGFDERFVERLVRQTTRQFQRDAGRRRLPPVVKFTLTQVFHTSRRAIVAILDRYQREADIRAAFAAFWSFQLAGLAGFKEWVLP